MHNTDDPQNDFDAWCFEIAALATTLAASDNLPAGDRRQLERIRTLAMRLHRFALDAEAAYLDHIDGEDDE